MRCPSTSDLVHAQANHAYDKLAVISDNIEALQAIYDFIFDIKEYLHQRLKEYMHKHRDELIDGQKTFTKPVRLEELELFSSVNADIEDTVGRIKLDFTTCAPYILFKVSRIDDETKEEYSSEVKLILDTCNGEPLLTIPPTNGDVPESAVRVDFLNAQLTAIGVRTTELESNTSDLPSLNTRISSIETKINNTLNYPVDGSSELVTSDGIYEYGQTLKQEILDVVNSITDTNTTYAFNYDPTTHKIVITPSSGIAIELNLSDLSGSNDNYIFAYPSGTVEDQMPTPEEINAWDIVTGDHLASAVEVSVYSTENHPDIVTYTIDQNSSLNSNSFIVSGYHGDETTYNPTNLSSSDSYRCIVAPVVSQGTVGGGNTRPTVSVRAGVFQRIIRG